MTTPVPETGHFGLTRVGQGEDLSKNGYSALDMDRITLDDALFALANHQHDNIPALTNPTAAPALTTTTTGGALPAGTTLYYRASLVDRWGLETAASSETSITTTNPFSAPTAPSLVAELTGGTLPTGTYSYAITYVDSNGAETQQSQPTSIQTTGTTSRVRITLPALPTGSVQYKIYRAKPGQTTYFFLMSATTSPTYDDNSTTEDQSMVAPAVNSTNATNSVTVTIPGGSVGDGVYGWKIYRSSDSGNYSGYSLVHTVVEPATTGGAIRTTWVDTGDVLNQGYPKNVSSTMGGGKILNLNLLQGTFPLSTIPRGARTLGFRVTGAPANGAMYGKTTSTSDIQPAGLTAFFQTAPTGLTGATPPDVRFRITDSQATPAFVELTCADNSGFYKANWPLTSNGTVESENGTRSDTGIVPIVSDVTASNGQAVLIQTAASYLTIPFGILDPGVYTTYFMMNIALNGQTTNDLTIQVIRTDSGSTLATATLPAMYTGYHLYTGPVFTAPAGVPVALKLTKQNATAQTYTVDYAQYQANLTTLAKGDLTLTAYLDGSPSGVGSDVTITLWF